MIVGDCASGARFSSGFATTFAARAVETMEAWGARPAWETATADQLIKNWTKGAVNFCRMYRPLLTLMMNDPDLRIQYDEMMAHPPRILTRLLRRASPVEARLPRRVLPGEPTGQFDRDVEWAALAALAVLERFDLDDDELYERIETLLRRMIGVD